MSVVPPLAESQIEPLAKVLGECGSGSDITRVLDNLGLDDHQQGYTKWWRLYDLFLKLQSNDKCANRILDFIQQFLAPARFVRRNDEIESRLIELNMVLAFSGLKYGSDGQFKVIQAASTLTEAEQRANAIQAKFQGRRIHPEVLKYCKAELMHDNYFHAVFEASKGLAQRIREKSGVNADGAHLVDTVVPAHMGLESPCAAPWVSPYLDQRPNYYRRAP